VRAKVRIENFRLTGVLFLMIITISCSQYTETRQNTPSDLNDAKRVANIFHNYLKEKNYKLAYDLLISQDSVTFEKMINTVGRIKAHLGDFLKAKYVNGSSFVEEKGKLRTGHFEFEYKVFYQEGEAIEKINLEYDDNSLKIRSFYVMQKSN
jgi:DNA-dependent RNA polymerase auxiliary subunit epsilon